MTNSEKIPVNISERKTEDGWMNAQDDFFLSATPIWFEWLKWMAILGVLGVIRVIADES